MIRIVPRLFAGLAAVLVTVPIGPAMAGVAGGPRETMAGVAGGPWLTAAVAEPTPAALTWAVQPANQDGPDGRRWIELTLDPGQLVTEHLAVRNFSDGAVVFSLQAADGYLTDNGRFNMLPSNRTSVDGGTWIGMQETVTVEANETAVVPFTITVPPDATPGDHPAGVAATVTSGEGTVGIESRVGFRVMMRVSGTVTAAISVSDFTATYQYSWNPFAAGTIRVSYTMANDGNVAVTGTSQVTTAGPFGLGKNDARTEHEEVFPGGNQAVDTRVAGVWPWGPLRTSVEVTGAAIQPAAATVTVWTVPWPQLVLAAIIAALVLTFWAIIGRRRRRLAQLLARARDEGRAEGRATAELGQRTGAGWVTRG